MKKYIIGILVLAVLFLILFYLPPETHESVNIASDSEYYFSNDSEKEDSLLPEDLSAILDKSKSVPIDTNPLSITVLVNRSYLLPSTYVPDDLRPVRIRFSSGTGTDKAKLRGAAAEALETLFRDAEKDGITFRGVSGYRSYERQKQIYTNNLSKRGAEETDNVSAKPGSSEHQTGLAIDISAPSVANRLDQALGSAKEGKWLASHAHRYGYIIRYPKGKEYITGYSYEPWHIRYVGKDTASFLYKNDMTLEEYYGTTCDVASGLVRTGVDVENADTVTYSTPEPAKKPEPTAASRPSSSPRKTPVPSKKPKPKKTRKPEPTKAPEEIPKHTPPPEEPLPEQNPVPPADPSAGEPQENSVQP